MRAIEIEAWVRRIIDRVADGRPIEDGRVELKGDWPSDYSKATRRIAGHCNAANGESVLWIIGVDEKSGITGVSAQELSTWWPQVKSRFEGESPVMRDLNVDFEGDVAVALLFESDRAPFVVQNPAHGNPGGGPVQFEVPWRDATSVRTAKRAELLRILLPMQEMPTLEITQGSGRIYDPRADDDPDTILSINLLFYAISPMDKSIVLPKHQATLAARPGKDFEWIDMEINLIAHTPRPARRFDPLAEDDIDDRHHTVLKGDNQLILKGPGFFRVTGRAHVQPIPGLETAGPLEFLLNLRPAGYDLAVEFSEEITQADILEHKTGTVFEWRQLYS